MGMFSRIGQLFKGFLSLFISGLEESNPEALLEAAKTDFRSKMAQYNDALARLAGITERLKIQIKSKTTRGQELERRIMANYKSGNSELAGSLARELQELKADLEHDTAELKDSESAYEANVRNAKLAQKEFEDKVRRIEQQLSQVKVKEAQAEAAAALNGVAFKVGDMGDTLKTVEDVLGKRYEKAAGKARVATDMSSLEGLQEKETERKALEQNALAEFLAGQGIQMEQPAPAAGEPAQKEIGPQSEPQKN
ncbi:MAG TPA: PspA/IM30 family protein [Acidobacteriota bacterium]|nr:PspA/IM30 family protein [Acidobacteriota bacterium]